MRNVIFTMLLLPFTAVADQLVGKVVDVHDGDTITVLVNTKQYKVRLDGIDAPEAKQAFGEVSRKSLAAMVAGKDVTVTWTEKDHWGRTLGKVSAAGLDANLAQVKAGMAWHFTEYNKEQKYADAQTDAKAKKLGLWVDKEPMAPWEFRADSKSKSNKKKK